VCKVNFLNRQQISMLSLVYSKNGFCFFYEKPKETSKVQILVFLGF